MIDTAAKAAARGRYAKATDRFRTVLELSDAPEVRSYCLLCLGRVEEQRERWVLALEWYLRAFEMDQQSDKTWYFLNNNAGYCMNRLGRHREAEAFCRMAIGIDVERSNGWKNLGIALEGLGQWSAAAEAYLEATECCVADTRSMGLLHRLLEEYPEAVAKPPELAERPAVTHLDVASRIP
ncbi:MAG: tetratricopeptide repeat protein [Spirochaetaceae bacterium]|nr:MAG: tetratricopeptide repeat protein [Spirochaetaceae bacterium]